MYQQDQIAEKLNQQSVLHRGVVESIVGERVRVRFVAHSACSGCHAKGVCNLSEVENKFVEVPQRNLDLTVGEEVDILLERNLGLRAVLFGYVIPLILLLLALILVYEFTEREGAAAIAGIAILIPYYLLLYLLRNRLSRSFHFVIRKTE